MANHKSALKRIRRNERAHQHNRLVLTSMRTYLKGARVKLTGKNETEAQEALRMAVSALDQAAGKGVIHPNNAARRKSRLMLAYNRTFAARPAA
ncbi:30S ribosomal protein S20 [Candidatus Amarolinea dominans]|uniref:30S ribosomal protein S20 n=1 Tax=Candidatus Amarolinea dominans TaxID=3140696 RepID=UPI001E00E13A|nr:30S ribosomal protein S20 [Anaerolineae bacterium]